MTRAARAFTLVEVLVVAVCFATVVGAIYQFWAASAAHSKDIEERIFQLSRAQLATSTIARELAQARRLLYPAPGRAQAGLAFIDREGNAVLYAFDREAGALVREERPAGDAVRVSKRTLLTGVADVECRGAPVSGGRDPDLAYLSLALKSSSGRVMHVFTSARLRAPDIRCPSSW